MELRPYQKEALSALWGWFRANPEGAPLLILPTGAGKSILLAEAARQVCEKGKDRRVLILAHRRELLEQNYQKLSQLWPFGSMGIFSAGLKRKESDAQVVFAGVQSAFRKADELGAFSLCIVDECHLIPGSGDGMYQTLIEGLRRNNPAIRFAGMTATPYRLDSGLLTQGDGLFTGVAYEVNIRDLIRDGYLSPLISKCGKAKANLSLVSKRGGEFVQEEMERAFNRLDLVETSLEEIVTLGRDRKSWLIFASGVQHAAALERVLLRVGVPAGVITGDTPPLIREQHIRDFKVGRLRALINCEVLTTGFDHPGVDLIAVLRATQSTALWVQICGRGARKAEGKSSCLILDFGGNSLRCGPIDLIRIVYRRNPVTGKDDSRVDTPPVKECPDCHVVIPLAAKECPECGVVFPELGMRLSHQATASNAPILSTEEEQFYDVDVYKTEYERHKKRDKPIPTMRADYSIAVVDAVPVRKISEWVCFEHPGFAGDKARKWFMERGGSLDRPLPQTVEEGLQRVDELKNPKKLRIKRDGKYWRVLKVLEFHERGEGGSEQWDAEEEDALNDIGINI